MSHRNHRSMPHPVLSKQRNDYAPECSFGILTPHTRLAAGGRDIVITIKYRLASPTLLDMIATQQARYVTLVECARTYRRESYACSGDEDVLTLTRSDWQETLTITPYVTTAADIAAFTAPEHNALVKALSPNGADLPAGAILAIGDLTVIELDDATDVKSIFDLAPDRRLAVGTFSTNLTGERIAINLHPEDLTKVNIARNQAHQEPLLHQGLYLHALDKAIRNLPDYPDQRWANVIRQKIQEAGFDPDDADNLAENSERYAQAIFRNPLASMLDTMQKEASDERPNANLPPD